MRARAWMLGAALLCACQPGFESRPSELKGPRVLAVRSQPAEALPGEVIALDALFASPSGELPSAGARWDFCMKRLPVADNNTVASECATQDAPWIRPIGVSGSGPQPATIPIDSCQVFGSETPPAPPGQPPLRPVDPDVTGGYHQPVRVVSPETMAFGRVRILCALPQASATAAREYRERYRLNENPALSSFIAPDLSGLVVRPGERVRVRAVWPDAAAEAYVVYNPQTRLVEDRREVLRVSWFSAAGALELDSSEPGAPEAENLWTAPQVPGPVHLWAVLRDDRGGASWQRLTIEVQQGF